MITHSCKEYGCLLCMITDLYEDIAEIKQQRDRLAIECINLKNENGIMDKKIKKIEKKEKSALKDTKELLKMDKKQDKKMAKCDMKMKKKK